MKKSLIFIVSYFLGLSILAQMPGIIIDNAGKGASILDPTNDECILKLGGDNQFQFSNAYTNDFIDSEIPYIPIVNNDLSNDLLQGPAFSFADIVGDEDKQQYAALIHFDGQQLLFRIRIDNYAPNSKGYSILIDTDQKFGVEENTADTNAVPGNPGFEVEIALLTKKSINLYLVDGTTNPIVVAEYPFSDYAHRALALSQNNNDSDYFYDFFIPFEQLTSLPNLGISSSSPLRFAVVSNLAPKPSIGSNSIADIAGISSTNSIDEQFVEVMTNQVPIILDQMHLETTKSADCPPVSTDCISDTTIWTGAVNNDWHLESNWTNGVPTTCSPAIIPTLTEALPYPIISCPATCASISFNPGAGVLGLQFLHYEKAFVELSLQRNQWYSLTPPLKNMYAADFYFEGSPVVYAKKFTALDEADLYYPGLLNMGMWTSNITALNDPLVGGKAHFVSIATKTFHYPNPITYETANLRFSLPRTTAEGSLLSTVYNYHPSTGYLFVNNPILLPRDTAVAYRFVAENADGVLQNSNIPLNQGLNLVANPYMSHIDLDALYQRNQDKISPNIKLWNGTTFSTFVAGSGISSNPAYRSASIPPMQGFWVEAISSDSLEIDLQTSFCAAIEKISPTDTSSVLHIISDNGYKKSATVIALRPMADNRLDESDAFKLFSQYTDVPEIYTVLEEVKLDVNQFSSLPFMASIGIYSELSGNIALKFEGANSFENMEVILMNTSTGEQQDLKINNNYTIQYKEGVNDGYLFVEFRNSAVTKQEDIEFCDRCIAVTQIAEHTIRIESPPNDKIENITVWEQSGLLLYSNNKVNSSVLDVYVPAKKKTCVVRVATEKANYVVKLLLK